MAAPFSLTVSAALSSYSHFDIPSNLLQPSIQAAEQLRIRLMNYAPAVEQDSWRWRTANARASFGLVDIRRAAPQIAILPAPVWSASKQRFWVRPELASRLELAARALPAQWTLGFWEGFRPLTIQRSLWVAGLALLSDSHPELSQEQLENVLETYVARPTANAPHSAGNAVDVAVINASGQILDATTAAGRLGLAAMSRAMKSAGLSNYEPEWWHWSYEEDGEYFE